MATLNKTHRQILENVFDVLACNTQYVSADEISSNFDMEIDYANGIITLKGTSGEGTLILKSEFIPE